MKYEEVYEDYKYLWSIGPANDMTGGYVDSEDLDKLLKSPTKTTAKKCLINQIRYWFQSGLEFEGLGEAPTYEEISIENPGVIELEDKYYPGFTW